MAPPPHTRRLRWSALTAGLCSAVAGCSTEFPNTTLVPHSEFGGEIDRLFYLILALGIVVFVLVELGLFYTVVRYRHRPGEIDAPRAVHGHTALEITWTLIPAVILAVIAVPTVRTIFRTQAKAVPNALQVEVVGHQWWWEFRYPQFGVVTANELYLPVGRTVNFALRSQDVLHSFWIPALAGKRDLITNHTNYLWFTPDSGGAWNGFCAEFCGASHANMRFKVFTVTAQEFDRWIAHQRTGPAFGAPAEATAPGPAPAVAQVATSTGAATPAGGNATPPVATPVTNVATGTYPRERLPRWVVPSTPLPAGLAFSASGGDPARGAQLFRTSACIACHTIQGVSVGACGFNVVCAPNLTHVGSRTTIAGAIYPNDVQHLTRWIKNAPVMKPGSLMPVLGRGEKDPTGRAPMGAFTDQQIADIAAYLMALK